jgi:hypothetical protein
VNIPFQPPTHRTHWFIAEMEGCFPRRVNLTKKKVFGFA